MKCNRKCLECEKPNCIHALEDIKETIDELEKKRLKERHAKYYQKNREAIIKKQEEWRATHSRKEWSKAYYRQNKQRIDEKNHQRYLEDIDRRQAWQRDYYARHKEEIAQKRKRKRQMMNNKERIRAIMGNIKNWSWDVYPKFAIEKEDAEALQDVEALREYLKEKEVC